MSTPAVRDAQRLQVRGVVQGVGFRPFVHRLADSCGLAGWVRNGNGSVEIEVEGDPSAIADFAARLRREAPPLARIVSIDMDPVVPVGAASFAVHASRIEPGRRQPVPPDIAVCARCEAELRDPANRRYRYPFITCTDCGPRYTLIECLPYDRERTSMRLFSQCEDCKREYTTQGDRRYLSETNSCPVCGPRLWLADAQGVEYASGEDALREAARRLTDGGIVAIRGLGGFHLAVDATNDVAVATLRERKHREAKPLALMVASLAAAREIAVVSPEEEVLLVSPERPIVLLEAAPGSTVSPGVSGLLGTVGVMLPGTPLHQLLLDQVSRPLVMTSGNPSEEPIIITNSEALERLGRIADVFLLHDRNIVARCDDSVLRAVSGTPRFLRRARGYAPLPVPLPVASPVPLVAVGPHLKNTFTLVHGGQAWVSPHIGDLENLETLEHFQATLHSCQRLFRVTPAAVAHDLHPGYLSTRVAQEMGLERVIAVQHHHAHVAAVMAEHGITQPVIGVAFDGTGYGSDGKVWGAEILQADLTEFKRLSHLRYVPLPGGDLAARSPWRTALGYLSLAPHAADVFVAAFEGVGKLEWDSAEWQMNKGINSPEASSMGRLFDAAAAILGIRQFARYEGQAAMELEALAGRRPAREIRCRIELQDGVSILDPLPLLIRLGLGKQRGEDIADLAADFHASIAWNTATQVRWAAEVTGLSTVVLSGGVFQNARLLWSVETRLREQGFTVLSPVQLGANDGAISYGQAAVAAARLATA